MSPELAGLVLQYREAAAAVDRLAQAIDPDGLDFDVADLRLRLRKAGRTLRQLARKIGRTSQPAPSILVPSAN
jgi:hypothetical protein